MNIKHRITGNYKIKLLLVVRSYLTVVNIQCCDVEWTTSVCCRKSILMIHFPLHHYCLGLESENGPPPLSHTSVIVIHWSIQVASHHDSSASQHRLAQQQQHYYVIAHNVVNDDIIDFCVQVDFSAVVCTGRYHLGSGCCMFYNSSFFCPDKISLKLKRLHS